MEPRVIKNHADHENALRTIEALAVQDPKPGTSDGDRLEVLATLVEHYEKTTFPIDSPDPIAAIRFRMDQQGLTLGSLVRLMGSRSRVSEILSKRRRLSLAMIRSLHLGLGIPAEVLLRSTKRRGRSNSKPNRD